MNAPERAAPREPSLAQDWLHAVRYWLGGRRGVLALAGFAAVVGIGANWSWLVAAGIAPLLISLLPCAVMCGLGLCMSRMMGGSCSGKGDAAKDAAAPEAPSPPILPSTSATAEPATLEGGGPRLPAQAAEVVARTQTQEEEKTHA